MEYLNFLSVISCLNDTLRHIYSMFTVLASGDVRAPNRTAFHLSIAKISNRNPSDANGGDHIIINVCTTQSRSVMWRYSDG